MLAHTIDLSTLDGGLYASRGDSVIACSIVFLVLCTVCLVLRFLSHHIGNRSTSLEDWFMIPAWILMLGLCANVICSVKLGRVGRHQAYVLEFEPKAIVSWAQTLFVTELIYGLLMALEKTAILLLYLRLFQIHRWVRLTTYALITFIWMWGIIESLVAIFQCKPVAFQWNKNLEGTCIDQIAYYRYVRVPNVVHDIVMLVLPMPVVWKMQIAVRQKLALICIFSLGSIGCIASFISMVLFFRLDAFSDNTWASVQLMSWTLAEPGVIFICACLPALWPLMLSFMPRIATLRYGSRNTTNQQGYIESQQGAGEGVNSSNDDSIPLRNYATYTAARILANSHDTSEIVFSGKGINITKEFSWEEAKPVLIGTNG
ncbi:hypothetical protein K505DRAFT_266182 [Melanomma pulvis-pyrius CBS 109.77]|uniref:Rhodopsin domain-containing protein n=1 Tax=Melanomma pulvis-pyrius CBS 109.77 TaxID=1314802 RepID=A0A6A6XUJ7_9PLEO|nr:hypothetical protein K505DRAFT_266182 [Melanomma pulvis-pyrius CBS 109.77]